MVRNWVQRWLAVCWVAVCLSACQSPPATPAVPKTGLTEEQIQLLRKHGFEDQDGAWSLMVPAKLLFALGTDQLESQQTEYVSQLAHDLLRVGIQSVRVEGHTDDTGSAQYNQQLSERRAQRVADVLVRAGMAPEHVSTRGWGNSKPLPMVGGQGARKENRRVAIIIPAPLTP